MKKLLFFVSAVAMLASCSKDMTEDVAVPVSGISKIYADYTVGDPATRTHAQVGGNGFTYIWDASDAIGVFANKEKGDNTNAMFKNTSNTAKGEFDGNLKMVAGNKYVAYYPYSPTTKFEETKGITLNILENQNYNHDGGSFGSFAQGAAPAVATGTAEEGVLTLSFTPVTSYIVVPIKGLGDKVTKVELAVGEDQQLWGEISVDPNAFDDEEAEDEPEITLAEAEEQTTITLNCGEGVTLSKDKETYFWFVVPAGLELKGEMSVTVTSVVEDGEDVKELSQTLTRDFSAVPATMAGETIEATVRNYAHVFGPNATDDFFYNPGGEYIITNEYEFLMYADAVTNGKANGAEAVAAMWKDGNLRPAVIIANLDFTQELSPKLLDVDKATADYLQQVLLAYNSNGKAIKTIGDVDTKVEISGVAINAEGTLPTIKGLTVKGVSMFNDGDRSTPVASVVKNLTFVGCTVDATGIKVNDKDVEKAFFLTNRSTSAAGIKFVDVTVGADCKVLPTTLKATAVVGRAFTKNLQDITNESALKDADVFYINEPYVDFTKDTFKDYDYNKLTVHSNSNGAILNVKDEEAAAKIIGDVDLTVDPSYSAKWYSVVSGYKAADATATPPTTKATVEMSYWTGTIADAEKVDDIFTAEELAFAVKSHTSAANSYKLTNDINLMGGVTVDKIAKASNGKNWADVLPIADENTYSYSIDGKKSETANYTISNVWIQPAAATTEAPKTVKYVTLFGFNTNVTNLNVKNVVINDKNVTAEGALVSGLTIATNKIENVKVENIDITAAKTAEAVGGVAQWVRVNNTVDNVEFIGRVTGVTGNKRGSIAGKVTGFVGSTKTNNLTYTSLKATRLYEKEDTFYAAFGQVSVEPTDTPAATGATSYDLALNLYDFSAGELEKINFVAPETIAKTFKLRVSYGKDEGKYKDFTFEKTEE